MFGKFWQEKNHVVHNDSVILHCYFTIYSHDQAVTDKITDAYLNPSFPFDKLMSDLEDGQHHLFVSDNLAKASQTLIALQKSGELANIDGIACHLSANINPRELQKLIKNGEDFREYLQEINGFCSVPALDEQKKSLSMRAS